MVMTIRSESLSPMMMMMMVMMMMTDDDDDVMGGLVTDPRRLIGSHNPSAHQLRHAWEPDDEDDDGDDQSYF